LATCQIGGQCFGGWLAENLQCEATANGIVENLSKMPEVASAELRANSSHGLIFFYTMTNRRTGELKLEGGHLSNVLKDDRLTKI
jgi:hypothetical protein